MAVREVKTEDGYLYRVGPVKTSAAIRAAGLFANLVGPSLVALGRRANVKEAIGFLLQADGFGDNLARICELLRSGTAVVSPAGEIEKLDDTFEAHFAGRGDALLPWLFAAVEVNVFPFMSGVAGLEAQAEAAAEALASKFQKLSAKSGSSGA